MGMSRRQFLQVCGLGAMSVLGAGVLTGCGGQGKAPAGSAPAAAGGNAAKPVVFYNRQPSNSSTGELDMTTLQWNKDTYYVGFDANQGGELEGQMVVDYIKKNADKIDRNGDGIIGYVLAIGDVGHNDSIARTRGCRKALGTAVEKDGNVVSDAAGTNTDGSSTVVKDGEIEVDGKKFIVRELASQEMKTTAGSTWDAPTAGNAIGTWASAFGDQIDIIVSNNDGMGMAMFNAWSKEHKVPTFGYDANSDAVAAIAEGYAGTVSQNPGVQAYLTLRLLRNAMDGVDIQTGVGKEDEAGNMIAAEDFKYSDTDRSFYAMNLAVTPDNYKDFMDPTMLYKTAQSQLDESKSPKKKVWLSIYNSGDNFLSSTYQPLLKKYMEVLNLDVDFVAGDGQSEATLTNRLGNPSEYDAFAINMVKTDNGASYTALLG
ncbi:substrate-binding domain-containing protein [Collinsella sp. AGMB00827]|uniref:Substrate-binding domain-containing protein n=1 Tax=Collinsella ureilytica TaxID=2869515 RepID=A0ABS7MJK0_9ACTN|nr:substrate-binding domain-containing protein [Collinsella urealyticum]MBY4797462.1 substrate-binding domain-containing protein [Collinsella urealyticum]